MYGFLFESGIKELAGDAEDYPDIIEMLNDVYASGEIIFGELDEDSDDFYCYAAIEITSDIYEDAEDRLFSMDLDQIKMFDKDLLSFIDGNPELNEVVYSNSPRIFFLKK